MTSGRVRGRQLKQALLRFSNDLKDEQGQQQRTRARANMLRELVTPYSRAAAAAAAYETEHATLLELREGTVIKRLGELLKLRMRRESRPAPRVLPGRAIMLPRRRAAIMLRPRQRSC